MRDFLESAGLMNLALLGMVAMIALPLVGIGLGLGGMVWGFCALVGFC